MPAWHTQLVSSSVKATVLDLDEPSIVAIQCNKMIKLYFGDFVVPVPCKTGFAFCKNVSL